MEKITNKGLHHLYASPNNIRLIRGRRIKWAGHVTRMGDIINAYKFWSEILKEEQGVDGRIIL
jgi:hypothetical protein